MKNFGISSSSESDKKHKTKSSKTYNGANIFCYIGNENDTGEGEKRSLKSFEYFFRNSFKSAGEEKKKKNNAYINDVYNASGSYKLDMGSIDEMNPLYLI